MNINEVYQILEIDSNSSKESVRQRHLDLAAVWHPDRHSHNPRLQKIAADKMKQINAAYDYYCNYSAQTHAASQDSDSVIIVCIHCGTKNRLNKIPAALAKCGNCGEQLVKNNNSERMPCGDDSCTGTIGENGTCNYCGKTFDSGRSSNYRPEDHVKPQTPKPGSELNLKKIRKRLIFAGIAFFIIFILAYDNNKSNQSKSPQDRLPLSDFNKPTASSPTRPTAPSHSASQPTIERISFGKAQPDSPALRAYHFANTKLSKVEIVKIQTILSALGYAPVNGNNYLTALKGYCIDFSFTPTENFPTDFFDHSSFHLPVANEHPDWKNIFSDKAFEEWINNLPVDYRRKIIQKGIYDTQVLIILANKYKFFKNNPPSQTLPNTGIIKKNFREGIAPIEIVTRETGKNHYIKLVNKATKKETLTAFIRGGESFSLDIPLGTYDLKYALGDIWYGPHYLFGPQTSYSRAKENFVFTKTGNQVSGYTIELFRQVGGNLPTELVSEFDF